MHKSQANRAVLTARATSSTASHSTPRGTVSTNPALRPLTVVRPGGNLRNRSAMKMTGAQKNSLGQRSEWARSPYAPYGGWQ